MAVTSDQLKYVESLYRDELARDQQLNSKAQVYFSIISLILSSVIFSAKDLKDLIGTFSFFDITFISIMGVSILFAFACVLSVLAIYEFRTPTRDIDLYNYFDQKTATAPDPKTATTPDPKTASTPDTWNDDRAAEFFVAKESVVSVREAKAAYLATSLKWILVCFIATLVLIALNLK